MNLMKVQIYKIIKIAILKENGVLTSFNIEELDTAYWAKIDEVFVKNEEMVDENQKILKVSNMEATGEISSTISGKFFIQEGGKKNSYYIYDLNNVGIEFLVDEEESIKLKLGQKVNLKFTGNSEIYKGNVYYIQKIPSDGTVNVKVKIDYSDKLKFGCVAKAEILVDEESDSNIKEFDIKNTVKRVGKTKVILKNSGEQAIQEFDMDALFEEYLNQMMSEMNFEDALVESNGEMPFEFEDEEGQDIEELSQYYSDLWNEHWNEYWKEKWKIYYEEYPIYITEPSVEDTEDESKNELNQNIEDNEASQEEGE